MAKFDTSLRDSQSSAVAPIPPERFDVEAYADYEQSLRARCASFFAADEGLVVHRRFRADGVFYDACRDMRQSLALQLGALKESMRYRMDVPNFLEPWYGIGYIACCYGGEYIWTPGQAPAVRPAFESCAALLRAEPVPIRETDAGRTILEMIEYFLDATKGKLPVSFSDVQSPLNLLTYLVPMNSLFEEVLEEPEAVRAAADVVTGLLIDFLKDQRAWIGDCLASPGHGFASARDFRGVGLSDDISLMVSSDAYAEMFAPCDERIGDAFGGVAYHSCGNWRGKIDLVKGIRGIVGADGAFSPETDPSPNRPEDFAGAFAGSGIALNARAVGGAEDALAALGALMAPGQKLIAVTYCKTPEEQEAVYRALHAMRGI